MIQYQEEDSDSIVFFNKIIFILLFDLLTCLVLGD
jgi:hypothetical protein